MRNRRQFLPPEAITSNTLSLDQVPVVPEHPAKGEYLSIN